MPVLLSFDLDLANEVASALDNLPENISQFINSYPKANLLTYADENDPVFLQYQQDLLESITTYLQVIHDPQLRSIMLKDITEYITSNHPHVTYLTMPYAFITLYEARTHTQVYSSGVYHLEIPLEERQLIDTFNSLSSYPSKKTLFIKYKLMYTMPDKLNEYIKSYIPIQKAKDEMNKLCLTKGSIEALPILTKKYGLPT